MKMSPEEKNFLNAISVLSAKDIGTVRDVLRAIIKVVAMELISHSDTVIIPYLCELKISHSDKLVKGGMETVVKLSAKPCQTLVNEVISIVDGDLTPTAEYVKSKINKTFQNILELTQEELDNEVDDL